MKINDIIVPLVENDVQSSIMDMLVTLAAEDIDSVSIDTIQNELSVIGLDVDEAIIFDIADGMDIVDNIKDNVIYFVTSSKSGHFGIQGKDGADPEKQDKKIDSMARQKVKKELDK
jgi:hypothetical protein